MRDDEFFLVELQALIGTELEYIAKLEEELSNERNKKSRNARILGSILRGEMAYPNS